MANTYIPSGKLLYGTDGKLLYGTYGKLLHDAQKRLVLDLYAARVYSNLYYYIADEADIPDIDDLYAAGVADIEGQTWPTPLKTTHEFGGNRLSDTLGDGDYHYGLAVGYGYVDTSTYSGNTLVSAKLDITIDSLETTGNQINLGYWTQGTTAVTESVSGWAMPFASKTVVTGETTYAISLTLSNYLFFSLWTSPIKKPDVPAWHTAFDEQNSASTAYGISVTLRIK